MIHDVKGILTIEECSEETWQEKINTKYCVDIGMFIFIAEPTGIVVYTTLADFKGLKLIYQNKILDPHNIRIEKMLLDVKEEYPNYYEPTLAVFDTESDYIKWKIKS